MWTTAQALEYAAWESKTGEENESGMCCHFVAECFGFTASGYTSAAAHAQTLSLNSNGTPVAGAAVFWSDGGFGHEALADGQGNVWSPDILRPGRIDLVPLDLIASKWGMHYLGWAPGNKATFAQSVGTNTRWTPPIPAPTPPPAAKQQLTLSVDGKSIWTQPVFQAGSEMRLSVNGKIVYSQSMPAAGTLDATFVAPQPVAPPPPKPPAFVRVQAIQSAQVLFQPVADYSCTKIIEEVCADFSVPVTWWLPGGLLVAQRESSYIVNAVNTYDSNAVGPIVADGHPEQCSRGSWQFIYTTFARWHHPGYSSNIYDGKAQFGAFINYTMGFYGVSADGHDLAAKVNQANPNHAPEGY